MVLAQTSSPTHEAASGRWSRRLCWDLGATAAAVALFVAQQASIALLGQSGFADAVRRAILLAATFALAVLALRFRGFLGGWLVVAGVTLNFAPMALHGGLMPVSYETIQASGAFPEVTLDSLGTTVGRSKDVVLPRNEIRAEFLADRHYLAIPGYRPNIYSFGDLVLMLGVVVAAVESLIFVGSSRWKFGTAASWLFGAAQRRFASLRPGPG